MSGADVIQSLPCSNNGIRISKLDVFCWKYGLQYELPVVQGHWRVMIKITDDTDYYYCYMIKLSSYHLYTNPVLQ